MELGADATRVGDTHAQPEPFLPLHCEPSLYVCVPFPRMGLDAYRLQLGVSLDDETVGVSLDDETGCYSLVGRIQPLGSPLSPMP